MQNRLIFSAIIFEALLGLAAVLLGWILGPNPLDRVHWQLMDLVWGLGALGPMLLIFWSVSKLQWQAFKDIRSKLDQSIGPLFAGLNTFDLLLISVLAGVCEELVFRGWLEMWLASYMPILVALILTNLLFGMAHWITTTYALIAALMGGLLSGLCLYFDNLLVAIVIHALYDFMALWYHQRIHSEPQPQSEVS